MQVDAATGRGLLEPEETQPWVQVAFSARVMQEVLRRTPPPVAGSMLDTVGKTYPEEAAAHWCRSFLVASLEHLVMWADYVAPLAWSADAKVELPLRPAQTLARAALESASQAVWVLAPTELREVERRHMWLVLADWEEQRKATTDLEARTALKQKRVEALRLLGVDDDDVKAPSYLTLVTKASAHIREELPDPSIGNGAAVERLWRASAGAAHGKKWLASEFMTETEVDGWRVSMPDPAAITAILKLADKVMTYGVLRFADASGHREGLLKVQQAAVDKVYSLTPKLPGAPREVPRPPACSSASGETAPAP